jgi:hypothetical protein
MHAGKYLFVIRECGRLDIKNPLEETCGQLGFTHSQPHKQEAEGMDVDMEQINTNN